MGCYFEKQSIQQAFIQFGSYLAGPLGLEIRYWLDRTDQNMGIGQKEQSKISIGQTEGATQIFFQTIVDGRTGPPCPRPKSVWPIPVLGRGLHPGEVYLQCFTESVSLRDIG